MELEVSRAIKNQLLDRRERIVGVLSSGGADTDLSHLLDQVDAALSRLNTPAFGLCEVCHDSIEADRLMADPLVTVCLDHLTADEQYALEKDLELAAQIQRSLLPAPDLQLKGWNISHHYQPAGIVSGDYCDVITSESGDPYFVMADVSGKGIAASMLMSNLHAVFRSLINVGLPLDALMQKANKLFCESTLPNHYATLVCGQMKPGGGITLCNAGHLPSLLIRNNEVQSIQASSVPMGMFCDLKVSMTELQLQSGDTLILYTDGIPETSDSAGAEYGLDRLSYVVGAGSRLSPEKLIHACLDDLASFRVSGHRHDDLTMMVIRRALL